MSYFVTRRWGGTMKQPDQVVMKEVLDELDTPDNEHPDVSLEHESGWCISCFQSGLVVWENVEEGDPKHMKQQTRDQMHELWILLANGRMTDLQQHNWLDGYGS